MGEDDGVDLFTFTNHTLPSTYTYPHPPFSFFSVIEKEKFVSIV
jgi:hypothetical protein